MSDVIGSLRTEIVESEKARIDLLKWKIILIAALGAVGFGIGKDTHSARPVLLGFIPLVCAYVDVLCVHNDLRILVIASFLRTPTQTNREAKAYERLCEAQRLTFALEALALIWTTVVFSLLVALFCLVPDVQKMFDKDGQPLSGAVKVFLAGSAAIGLAVSVVATLFRRWRANKLSSP